jgi:aspartyl protease family protein
MRGLIIVAAVLLGLGALAFTFRDALPPIPPGGWMQAIYLVMAALLVGGGMFARGRMGPDWLRNAVLWLVILFAIMGAYSFRGQIGAMLNPGAARAVGDAMELRRGDDGHFWADVEINNTMVRMMVDTGASAIALSPRDARRIGLDPATLSYTTRVATAQGETTAAPVMLRDLRVGNISTGEIAADVMREEIGVSLLGMNFLNRLEGFEVRSDALLLHPARQ